MGEEASSPSKPAAPDDRLEAEIQLATKRALELLGFTVHDLSQDRPTRQTEGLADLYVVGHGRCAWVEMKRPGTDQNVAQRLFGTNVLANGGEYFVCRHESEAIAWAEAVIG